MIEQPALKPICCGQFAKWVAQTPSLQYFYCEACKQEVIPDRKQDTETQLDWGGEVMPKYGSSNVHINDGTATTAPASPNLTGMPPSSWTPGTINKLYPGAGPTVGGAKLPVTDEELDKMVKDALTDADGDESIFDYFPGNWGADIRTVFGADCNKVTVKRTKPWGLDYTGDGDLTTCTWIMITDGSHHVYREVTRTFKTSRLKSSSGNP